MPCQVQAAEILAKRFPERPSAIGLEKVRFRKRHLNAMYSNLLNPACLQQDRLASEVVWREAGLMLKELEPMHSLLEVSVKAAAVAAHASPRLQLLSSCQAVCRDTLPGELFVASPDQEWRSQGFLSASIRTVVSTSSVSLQNKACHTVACSPAFEHSVQACCPLQDIITAQQQGDKPFFPRLGMRTEWSCAPPAGHWQLPAAQCASADQPGAVHGTLLPGLHPQSAGAVHAPLLQDGAPAAAAAGLPQQASCAAVHIGVGVSWPCPLLLVEQTAHSFAVSSRTQLIPSGQRASRCRAVNDHQLGALLLLCRPLPGLRLLSADVQLRHTMRSLETCRSTTQVPVRSEPHCLPAGWWQRHRGHPPGRSLRTAQRWCNLWQAATLPCSACRQTSSQSAPALARSVNPVSWWRCGTPPPGCLCHTCTSCPCCHTALKPQEQVKPACQLEGL